MFTRIIFLSFIVMILMSGTLSLSQENSDEKSGINQEMFSEFILILEEDPRIKCLKTVSEPVEGFKLREIVIGENYKNFVTLSMVSSQPCFEHNYIENVFIKSYDLKTGELKDEFHVGQINGMISSVGVLGPTKGIDPISKFDIGRFLWDSFLTYAFPSSDYTNDNLSIQEKGLVFKTEDDTSLILISPDILKNRLSIINFDNVCLLPVFETHDHLFIQFQIEIPGGYEDDFYQITIPVNKSDLLPIGDGPNAVNLTRNTDPSGL